MLISTLVRIKYQKGALKRVESDCFQACEWGGEGCGVYCPVEAWEKLLNLHVRARNVSHKLALGIHLRDEGKIVKTHEE